MNQFKDINPYEPPPIVAELSEPEAPRPKVGVRPRDLVAAIAFSALVFVGGFAWFFSRDPGAMIGLFLMLLSGTAGIFALAVLLKKSLS